LTSVLYAAEDIIAISLILKAFLKDFGIDSSTIQKKKDDDQKRTLKNWVYQKRFNA
jgi:hypothetical protein